MAGILSMIAYLIFRKFRKLLRVSKTSCICISESQNTPQIVGNSFAMKVSSGVEIKSCNKNCVETYSGHFFGVTAQKVLDTLHFISAGIVSFARGLNDTPKIVGLLIIVQAIDIKWGMIAIAITMAIGGLLNAKKVGITMSKKITPMNHGQGFTANMITGLLVTTASIHGLPVSTTHVSVGSIFGIGTVTKIANARVISKILLSWVLTLPIAAALSGLIYMLLESIL
jgi:PiT family inorganic phosphate transporter